MEFQRSKGGKAVELERIISLRMARQGFAQPVDEQAYPALYRDMQPGRNVYWNGFGQPPTLTPRAAFDDGEYNRLRQRSRALVKVRLAGTVGWIESSDMPLFAALYRKPIVRMTAAQETLLALLRREGPLNIQQIKEETGWLVKEITPVLQRLQEAFCVYEDQYDGEWDREWYLIGEMFPGLQESMPERGAALAEILRRFARRMAAFTEEEARSFFRFPVKEIRAALAAMTASGALVCEAGLFMTADDAALMRALEPDIPRFVCAVHRNDFLYRACETELKAMIAPYIETLEYDHEPLQYLLIDGVFCGAAVGHFRNGPYDLNDVVGPEGFEARRDEIIAAVRAVNFGAPPLRFRGRALS